jgi:hypothetical protein
MGLKCGGAQVRISLTPPIDHETKFKIGYVFPSGLEIYTVAILANATGILTFATNKTHQN